MILEIPIQSHIHLLVNWFQLIFQVVNDAGREEAAVAQSVLDAQTEDHLEGDRIYSLIKIYDDHIFIVGGWYDDHLEGGGI